jgi:hypothetical protein
MATGNPVLYTDFSGGLNLEAGPYLAEDNQCQDCRNVYANRTGALNKRNGSTRVSTYKNGATPAVEQITHAHSLFATTGAATGFIAVGPVSPGEATDSIVKITTGGVTTTLETGLTANKPWEWVQGPLATDESPNQGPYYGMNGVDTPQYWDGTAATTEDWEADASQGQVPDGTPYLIYAQDRMWATGDPDYPGRIWKTGINDDSTPLPDPCNWDTDLIDDIDPDDGQITTGLGTVGPYVIVFKERKSYVISDGASGIYRTLSSSIGCSSHRSIVETTQGTLFLSEDLGVCITDGSNIRVVSDKIKPLLATISETQPIAYKRSVGVYFQDSYWLSIPYADNKNSITLQYQLDTGAWWIHSLAAADYAIFDSGSGAKLYGAVSEIAGMDQMLVKNVYTDNGSPFQSYWEGPYWTWGAPQLNKRISQYRIDGVGYWELDAGTTFGDTRQRLDWIPWESGASTGGDFGDSGTDFGDEGTFGATPTITQKRYYTPTDGWGRAWSLKIYDDNANANTMEIYSIAGFLRPRSD